MDILEELGKDLHFQKEKKVEDVILWLQTLPKGCYIDIMQDLQEIGYLVAYKKRKESKKELKARLDSINEYKEYRAKYLKELEEAKLKKEEENRLKPYVKIRFPAPNGRNTSK